MIFKEKMWLMNRKEPKVGLEIISVTCPFCGAEVAHTTRVSRQGCFYCGADLERAYCCYVVTTQNLWYGASKN